MTVEYWPGCNSECDAEDRKAVSDELVGACRSLVQAGHAILLQESELIVTDLGGVRRRAWLSLPAEQSYFLVCDVNWSGPEEDDSALSIKEVKLDTTNDIRIWQASQTTDTFPRTPEACNPHTLYCQKGKDPSQIQDQATRLSKAELILEEEFMRVLRLPEAEDFYFEHFMIEEE